MGQEELFTCEFLLLKLNIVDCMTDSTELGYDLSEKVSKLDEEDLKMKDMAATLQAQIDTIEDDFGIHDLEDMDINLQTQITALNTKLNTDVMDLETKITAIDAKLVAEIDSDITAATTALETKITDLETKLNALSALFNVRHWVIYIIQ